jgi:hypothetical protein
MKIVPQDHEGLQVYFESAAYVLEEPDRTWTIPRIGDLYLPIPQDLRNLLQKTRTCNTCGIIGTHMVVEAYDPEEKEVCKMKSPILDPSFHWMLYARVHDPYKPEDFYIRILPGISNPETARRDLGVNQVECVLCHFLHMELEKEKKDRNFQNLVKLGHRIYRASCYVARTRNNLQNHVLHRDKLAKGILFMQKAMSEGKTHQDLTPKIEEHQRSIKNLDHLIQDTLIDSQINGCVHDDLKWGPI